MSYPYWPEDTYAAYLEGVRDEGWLTGWAHWVDLSKGKLSLTVIIDDNPSFEVVADQFREDLYQAKFEDPACAFLYGIPDEFRDGAEHTVKVMYSDTNEQIPNSPQRFTLTRISSAEADGTNYIPNASFVDWPNGVFVAPTVRFEEITKGWHFDFRKGTTPSYEFSIEKPLDLGLRPNEYALRINALAQSEGYCRLVVPLPPEVLQAHTFKFALGIRRPVASSKGNLFIAEISLGCLVGNQLSRVLPIRKNVKPKGTMRIQGMPVSVTEEALGQFAADAVPALIIDFQGAGELILFSPEFAPKPTASATADFVGAFEDPAIEGQLNALKLSPIWTARGAPAEVSQFRAARSGESQISTISALPFVQIVVPVFNAAPDVDELLRSILTHTAAPFEVLIADDESREFTEEVIKEWVKREPRIRALRHEENLGYTRNINKALQSTVAEYVVLLNSDTIVSSGWLLRMFEAMFTDSNVAAVGPLSNAASWQSVPLTKTGKGGWSINPLPARVTVDDMASAVDRLSEAAFPEFPLLNGFCTLFRRSALESINFFDDEAFPQGYGEENDLCLRLRKAGYQLRVADHAYVFHKKSRSFGKERRSELARAANSTLRAKHPEVSLERIEEVMRGSVPLNVLRERLVQFMHVEIA